MAKLDQEQQTNLASKKKGYAEKLKAILVLFGEQNTGKSTTLRKLVAKLGNTPPLPSNDIRVIVDYRGKTIYIATYGDTFFQVNNNSAFFQGELNCSKVNMVKDGELGEAPSDYFHQMPPEICISASHPDGATVDAGLAFANYKMHLLERYQWIRKGKSSSKTNEAINADNEAMADKLVDIIDEIIDSL